MTQLKITSPNDNLPATVTPIGLSYKENFIDEDESKELIDLISQNEWAHEGFEDRRKVQRYEIPGRRQGDDDFDGDDEREEDRNKSISALLCLLGKLSDRIVDTMMKPRGEFSNEERQQSQLLRPNQIIIEERRSIPLFFFYPNSKSNGGFQVKKRPNATIFESNLNSKDSTCSNCKEMKGDGNLEQSSDRKKKCSCYVAQISLLSPCIQSMNKPKERNIMCWDLESRLHSVEITMNPNDLILKEDESLWNWRSRIEVKNNGNNSCNGDEGASNKQEEKTVKNITIKFRCIQGEKVHEEKKENSMRSLHDSPQLSIKSTTQIKPSPLPLHELLTIIVTTSPIKSNPSTELLEQTFQTFIYAGFDFCYNCEKIIVCDGVRIKSTDSPSENKTNDAVPNNRTKPTVSKKHANVKQSLRNGIATHDQAKNYEVFKEKLTKICNDAGSGGMLRKGEVNDLSSFSPFRNARVVELEERHGYGFALRHALRHEVKTPYVCVIQHDRSFMRHTPIQEVVESMRNSNGNIKYVGMNMRSNLLYRDIFLSKYGSGALNELLEMVVKPPELALDSTKYGIGVSLKSMVITKRNNAKIAKGLLSLAQTYRGTVQYTSHFKSVEKEMEEQQQLSLTPTLFWYDNTHVCETSHYRDFIFDPKYKMVARGGFVEDKLSPVITRSVERLGLKEGHSKFGCYLLDDHSGFFFTGHLDGGSFITAEERQCLVALRSN